MAANDITAVFDGLDSISAARLHREARKRQLQQDEDAREINRRRVKLMEEQNNERRWDRLNRETAAFGARADKLAANQAALEVKRQMEERAAKESEARRKLLEAQAAAASAKPKTPIDGTVQGATAYADAMAEALEANQRALALAQSGDPAGQAAVTKTQLRLAALQQVGNQLVKTAKPEPEPFVTVEIPGQADENAPDKPRGKVSMKVPQSQWNEQHPLWKHFAPAAPAASQGMPRMSAADLEAMKWAQANPADPRAKRILQRLTPSP